MIFRKEENRMRLNRKLMKLIATTLSVLMVLAVMSPGTAEAGLFSKIKDTVKKHPVASALGTVAVGAAAFFAAPHIAYAVGAASGVAVAGGAGAAAAVGGLGAGIAGIGSAIWGGLCAAGGFVTGALGAVGAAIGSVFSGIAGFIGGIIGSPLFVPALVVIGAAVVGYLLWKKYKRQKQDLGNGSNLPGNTLPSAPSVSIPSGEIAVNADQAPTASEVPPSSSNPVTTTTEIPVSAEQAPAVSGETAPPVTSANSELKNAHADYIKAYNKYISLVTNIGGSENPDEEMRSNMRRNDVQSALTAYRDAYNKYVTLLRQSNSK
jgi:hypothetical protein